MNRTDQWRRKIDDSGWGWWGGASYIHTLLISFEINCFAYIQDYEVIWSYIENTYT